MQGFGKSIEVKTSKTHHRKSEKPEKPEKLGGLAELRKLNDQIEQKMKFLANFIHTVETIISDFKLKEYENSIDIQQTTLNTLAFEPILEYMDRSSELSLIHI